MRLLLNDKKYTSSCDKNATNFGLDIILLLVAQLYSMPDTAQVDYKTELKFKKVITIHEPISSAGKAMYVPQYAIGKCCWLYWRPFYFTCGGLSADGGPPDVFDVPSSMISVSVLRFSNGAGSFSLFGSMPQISRA